MNRIAVLFICLALGLAGTSNADTYVVSFADIRDAIDNSDVPPDQAISAYLARTLRAELDDLGFDFEQGDVPSTLRDAVRELKLRLGHSPLYRVVEIDPWSRIPERRHALLNFDP